jgi:hypothetical protein
MKKIYAFCVILSSLFTSGCFTVPGKDRIITVNSYVNQDMGCIRPLDRPIEQVEYIPADQSLKSKVHYLDQCLINYSWGRGWTDKQDFQN